MNTLKEELTSVMNMIAQDPKAIFLGQSVYYPGHIMADTLKGVPANQILELPVAEELQIGQSIGLALEGFLPISIFPRLDFLIVAADQLINHLDKYAEMSCGRFNPKVIIRTMVGSIYPLYPGPQRTQNHTEALKKMLTNVDVLTISEVSHVRPMYTKALWSPRSSIIIEAPSKRQGYDT